MSAVEEFLDELARALRVRGRARRRLLRECHDHLQDSAMQHGPDEAVRRFGSPSALAAAFDTELAVRRTRGAAIATVVGVLAVGGSTLALVNASSPRASAVVPWAFAFFAVAQVSAVCLVLGMLRAATLGRGPATAADVSLVCRRQGFALAFAVLTLVCAGGALPGHASPVALLAGPAVALLAAIAVLRVRWLLRRPDRRRARVERSPFEDLAVLVRLPVPTVSPVALLGAGVVVAAVAAFLWDRGDGATGSSALGAAGVEVTFVVVGFVLLGRTLGLRPGRPVGDADAALR